MKIYEHEAKDLFTRYGIAVPKGSVARTLEEASLAAVSLGTFPVVLKAQIYAGGRGKAGGIKVAGSADEVTASAASLLGRRLVTAQTGEDGQPVLRLLVEEVIPVKKELYLGITIDRSARRPMIIASGEGGMEIEKLAVEAPEKIVKEHTDPAFGLRPFQASRISYALGMEGPLVSRGAALLLNLFRLFVEKDCSVAEINPLVVTEKGDLVALDGKINIDDNALFRHHDLAALRDVAQEERLEVQARELGLNYIKLKGNVGCMVNGAGLAMATMDLIKLVGAEPANFLDVGGGATEAMIREGLRIILSDRDVKLLFINIFGGILRCDTLARGVAEAAKVLNIGLPIVVRLEGTNKEMGQEILSSSGLSFIFVSSMREAAKKITELLGMADGHAHAEGALAL